MSSKGFALISSKELKIKEVLYNSEEFSFLEEGRLLPSFVDSDSRRKLLNFSKILEEKGAEFAYEIYVKVSEKVQAVFLSGTIINDNELLLIAPFEKEGIIDQYDYFMQVNNKYINQLRTLLKRQFKNINLSQENNFLKNRRDYNYIEFSKINNEAVTNQRQLVKTNNKLESKKDQISKLYTKLDNEINKAWKIHKRSFPNIIPDLNNIYIKAQYLPSERLGGDIYDIIKVENKLVFYLADVTGHGLDAAMMSSFIHHNIRDFLSLSQIDEIDTKSIIAFLMKRFAEEKFPQDYFICIFINILDLETMNLEYLGLGFQDLPLLIRDNEMIVLSSKGMPISPVIPEEIIKSNFEIKNILLKERDTLFFNTDGLVEQKNGEKYFGDKKLSILKEMSDYKIEEIYDEINSSFYKFNDNSINGDDDITYLIMKIND